MPNVENQIDLFEPQARQINPSTIIIVADATFYGKKSGRLGILVFKDVLNDKIVALKHTEIVNDYKHLVEELIEKGFVIQGVTIDAKRGVAKAFVRFLCKWCYFHQVTIINAI